MRNESSRPLSADLPQENKQIPWLKIILRSLGLTILILLIGITVWAKHQFTIFSQESGLNWSELVATAKAGWNFQPAQTQGYKNLLILGLDSLSTRGESLPLTDSIMIVSINLNTAQINLLSLPRDLWSEEYQTKINALYTYGLDRYPDQPAQFPQEVISQLTGVELHHTLVISMDHVAALIDLLGGIEIDVQHEFTDEEFPRTDVDVTTVTNPELLYETISFDKGVQYMDGSTTLKYMRSRHGTNDENTDDARSKRQQEVMRALINQLTTSQIILDARTLGKIYAYYLTNFSHQISPSELISLAKILAPQYQNLNLENINLKVYPDDENGTIEHPAVYLYDGQWVYTILDNSEFKNNIQKQLFDIKE